MSQITSFYANRKLWEDMAWKRLEDCFDKSYIADSAVLRRELGYFFRRMYKPSEETTLAGLALWELSRDIALKDKPIPGPTEVTRRDRFEIWYMVIYHILITTPRHPKADLYWKRIREVC